MFGVIVTLLAVVVLGYFVVKNYYPPIVLLLIGFVLLFIAWLCGTNPVTAKQATNFIGFDIVEAFNVLTKGRLSGLGLNIMAIAGFSFYMDKIGASKALVKACIKPLSKISSPYILLGCTYVCGQFMALFFNSAVGLGLLLMASIYPLLLALGVSRVSAAAVIATTCCLDLGPTSSNTMRAADLCQTDIVNYFINGQGTIALCVIATVAIGHAIIQRWYDKRDGLYTEKKSEVNSMDVAKAIEGAAPAHYAILPMLPLFLLLVFSPMAYKAIKLNLVTALFVSIIISLVIDLCTRRNLKECLSDTKSVFEGMGKVFASTVSLILCAELFALGLTKVGGITTMIQAAASIQGAGMLVMLFVMLFIMVVACIVTGSANSAFFAFGPLLPEAASAVGMSSMSLVVPVQLCASLARPMSPIAGVMIAVSGISGVSPFQLIRRTIPVMACGMVVCVIVSLIVH